NRIRFGPPAATGTAGVVTNIVDADRSILSLSTTQNTFSGGTLYHTMQINDGVTLTINGTSGPTTSLLQVGSNIDNATQNTMTSTVFVNQPGGGAGGTLKLDNA